MLTAAEIWGRFVVRRLCNADLDALTRALWADDPTLVQGATCNAEHNAFDGNVRACSACLLVWPWWNRNRGATQQDAYDRLYAVCDEIDPEGDTGERSVPIILWWDETPRSVALPVAFAVCAEEIDARLLARFGAAADLSADWRDKLVALMWEVCRDQEDHA